jgi:LacI family transcriptional regulator, repressor for deo operon, udp, cdd, tsx, nupC, and nupG
MIKRATRDTPAAKTTVHDVARYAGVSTASVSRVLNEYEHVSADVVRRVQRAINDLGYAPNAAAKSLRTLKSSKLIVSVPDISNMFFSTIIRSAEEAAVSAGYAVLIGDVGFNGGTEDAYGRLLRRKEADGMIFLGHSLAPSLREVVARLGARAPIVNACEFSADLGVSSVHIDNTRAAGDVMNHLYGLGHSRIGVITGDLSSPISRDRLLGVRTAAQARSLETGLQIMTGDYSIESGARLSAVLLGRDPRPTAIFCFSDDMAMGTLHTARSAGIDCPAMLSVVGFDDVRFTPYTQPALTTVHQPMAEIGRLAVEVLLDIIQGRHDAICNIMLDHALVIRESTGPAPV